MERVGVIDVVSRPLSTKLHLKNKKWKKKTENKGYCKLKNEEKK